MTTPEHTDLRQAALNYHEGKAVLFEKFAGAANIAYNLLKPAAGGNIAIGPVLLGSTSRRSRRPPPGALRSAST